MRIAIYVLVIANLALWAWANWIVAPARPLTIYDGPTITLLRELPPDSPLRAPPETAAPPGADSLAGLPPDEPEMLRCVVVGPFVDSTEADGAAARIGAADIATSRLEVADEVWDGYWVYIEQIADRDEAQSMLAELSDNGIDDAYMIPNSERGILISLGVYSETAGAGAQAERVSALGFETTIADRTRAAEAIWLRMNIAGATDVLALLEEPADSNRLELRDCAELSD